MKRLNSIGKIEGNKLTVFSLKRNYNIYNIAFIEVIQQEIKIRNYMFFIFFLLNYFIYYVFNDSVFLYFFWGLVIIYCLSFSWDINPKNSYLQLSFKNFKNVKIPLKKRQLADAEVLIQEYRKAYQIMDVMNLSKKQASSFNKYYEVNH